jgi:hypothetical protein
MSGNPPGSGRFTSSGGSWFRLGWGGGLLVERARGAVMQLWPVISRWAGSATSRRRWASRGRSAAGPRQGWWRAGGDVAPAGAVVAGAQHGFGQAALGLIDQAGEQVDEHGVVTEPEPAPFGERGQGVVDEVEGVVVAAWGGRVDGHGCWSWAVVGGCAAGALAGAPPARVLARVLAREVRSR